MPPTPSIWSRVRKGRLVQVLAVYLGASWLLIQVTDALMSSLSLPAWVGPVVVLLLAVGLLVVLATAWVQSNPLMAERTGAEEVPAAWAVDVKDVGRSVRGGRLPHLTWARALVGGVFAFSLLFGLAGAYVLFSARSPGASPLAASTAVAPGVAVLPFDARGLDEELWSVGMVDLLTTNLDGVGGLRTIDSRTVLARWREGRAQGRGDLAATLGVASAAGARWGVVGNAVGVGGRVRLSARLYDVQTGVEHGSAQVEGDPSEILALVDALSIDLVRDLLRERQLPHVPARNLAAITTSSVPALRAYLRGEAANRRADFRGAISAYEEALAADSTFALAALRVSTAYGWIESRGSERSMRYRRLADVMSDRLPERDAALMRAFNQTMSDGDPAGIPILERLARTYPDDPEIWTMLGEAFFHLGPMALIPASASLEPFETAIALDSSFAPAYIHPIEMRLATGRDSAVVARLIDAYARYGAQDRERIASMRLAQALTYGGDVPSGDALSWEAVVFTFGTLSRGGTGSELPVQRLIGLGRTADYGLGRAGILRGQDAILHAILGRIGKFTEMAPDAPPFLRATAAATVVDEYGMAIPGPLLRDLLAIDTVSLGGLLFAAGVIATHTGREDARVTAIARLRQQADRGGEDAELDAAAAEALEALDLWRQGRVDAAAAELERIRVATIGFGPLEQLNTRLRYWLGAIEAERGRHQEALRYLATVQHSVQARLLMAESYEALGRPDAARAAYGDVLRLWADADPDFPPADRARRGLARLLAER
jgi:tetratricopeptide (TPR) repeat protein